MIRIIWVGKVQPIRAAEQVKKIETLNIDFVDPLHLQPAASDKTNKKESESFDRCGQCFKDFCNGLDIETLRAISLTGGRVQPIEVPNVVEKE